MHTCSYENIEKKTLKGGKQIVRKVSVKNGKGYKSVTHYHKGKKTKSMKKNIHKNHIMMIHKGKFIPGLFSDCNCKTRKHR